ncbi:MAG: ADP-dependent glucokinase/phosphofructokinase [Candidatus Asgardarchaeum sp.]
MTKKTITELIKIWDEKYRSAYDSVSSRFLFLKNFFFGFNINVDAIREVDASLLKLLEKNTKINKIERKRLREKKIKNLDDLLIGLTYCMEHGIGEEWKIVDENVYHWINKNVQYDLLSIGGQAGIMANTASVLGIKNILINAPVMTKTLASLLFKEIFVARSSGGGIKLFSPYIIATEKEELIHWIFEFKKGFSAAIHGKTFIVPNSTRFIATYDPINSMLTIDKHLKEYLVIHAKDFHGGIIAGHHLIDSSLGKKFIDERMNETINFIKAIKEANRNLLIKYELGITADDYIISQIKQSILPHVDIISLNENEFYIYFFGTKESTNISIEERCKKLLTGFLKILSNINVSIHLHTFDTTFFITPPVTNNRDMKIEKFLNATLFGSLVTSVRAILGKEPSLMEIRNMLENKNAFYYQERAFKTMNYLDKLIREKHSATDGNLLEDGFIETDNFSLIAIPIKFVENPLKTVGLGDTCSVSQFLALFT